MKFGRRSLNILNELHPKLQEVLLKAITNSPFDFGLHSGYRSPEEQYRLYQQGRTTPGNKVTWINGIDRKSYHNYNPALAFDFHCSIKGNTWDNTKKEVDGDPAYLEEIARHILSVGKTIGIDLEWGGDWKKTKDAPHIQLPRSYVKEAQNK